MIEKFNTILLQYLVPDNFNIIVPICTQYEFTFGDRVSVIRLHLIPFYGSYNIDSIKSAVISEFHRWRRNKVGRELSGRAQNNLNTALDQILIRPLSPAT
jgi:hypothetical protein